jgi:hypothetical protein
LTSAFAREIEVVGEDRDDRVGERLGGISPVLVLLDVSEPNWRLGEPVETRRLRGDACDAECCRLVMVVDLVEREWSSELYKPLSLAVV